MLLQVVFTLCALFTLISFLSSKRKSLPPGPTPWPILGNVPNFILAALQGKNAVQLLTEWKKAYGNVFTIWLGPMPAVNVCDYNTAVDAFVKTADAHTGRFRPMSIIASRGNLGLIFSDGALWQEQRRFSLHVLRNFGVGRNLMQQRILDECNFWFDFMDSQIEEKASNVLNPADIFDPMVGSIINRMLTGKRFDETNMEEFYKLKHGLDQVSNSATAFDHALLRPINANLPIFKQRVAHLTQPQIDLKNVFVKLYKERTSQIAAGTYTLCYDDPSDYVDAYLIEMEKRKRNGDSMGYFSEESLAVNMLDLWFAGMETTILTILWSIIHILNNPEVQIKAREEILKCTGGNRDVEMADKKNLPYFSAVVTETQRHASILNFNLWHKTTTKTMVGEYLIPEGVTIAPQLSVIMSNEDEFKDSDKFIPGASLTQGWNNKWYRSVLEREPA
ncbi:hypothetical protein L596_029330 [Steinernema carpocapsae]|uniref:Cytochrome P450 n=1 Tax=Steinernema carpocapsae TaxID=34508 RepID=A0A4U5LUB4_STECR|nr:hypothetical protein L596_029330 [Steinernema carpocapsae]